MANPQVPQGTLNRLRGSVVYADHPELIVTSPFLAKEGISLAFDGDASLMVGTMTGAVTSPEPYQIANVTIHILRTQILAAIYKNQLETSTSVGSISIITDSITLPIYNLENCTLQGVREMTFDGNNPGFAVTLRGVYQINSNLFTSI